MEKLFGTDGIRAKANRFPLNAETAVKVGRAVARLFSDNGKMIYVGQDTRLSSDMLSMAVASGICSAGLNACLLGTIPTPAVAYLTKTDEAAAGIVISASHNPYQDNGIKVFQSNGRKISRSHEKTLEKMIGMDKGQAAEETGRLLENKNGAERYFAFLKNNINEKINNIDIVIDCANGATSELAPRLFQSIGIKTNVIAAQPDGRNINAGCGSEHPQMLSEQVKSTKSQIGFAFDGDGDRLIAVDEKGNLLTGDQLLAIYANYYLNNNKLSSFKTVVSTVMSNLGLQDALKKMGLEHKVCQVGDRNVMETMVSCGALLGGESSGHLIFSDLHTTGDGILAAVMLLNAVSQSGKLLSELSQNLIRLYPQKLINVKISSKPPLESVPEIQKVIEEIENLLDSKGRVLVRYSGTENLCRVMVESIDDKLAYDLSGRIARVISTSLG